jgi:uncharacterized membrane protein
MKASGSFRPLRAWSFAARLAVSRSRAVSRKKGSLMTESAPSGLSDNGAGTLAYITFIPAILFLVMPPYNKSSYVRFHAWQSIFLNVLGVAVFIIFAVLGRIPLLNLIVIPGMLVVYLGLFILWLIVVLKALNGQRFHIPIIGPLAESQAAK